MEVTWAEANGKHRLCGQQDKVQAHYLQDTFGSLLA